MTAFHATPQIQYSIPLRGLKFSTNKIYAGIHWAKRKDIKDAITSCAGYFCRPIQKVGSYPVEIRYRFFFGGKLLDTLNCAAMAKMFEDALRALLVIKDDDPKCVARSILEVAPFNEAQRPQIVGNKRSKDYEKDKDWLVLSISEL